MRIEDITKIVITELEKSKKSQNNTENFTQNNTQNFTENENLVQFLQENQNYKEKIENQIEFLSALKERILVLFEGIENFDSGDISARVELSLKFMEFLLENLENQIEKLKI